MSDKPKDKLKYEVNAITGELDLVSEFNVNKIITHKLTPFATPRMDYDPVQGVYYEADDGIVTDSNGNLVVI